MTVHVEPITGKYIHCDINGTPHRLYVEEAGEGIPLLCLHTAGADARQFRAVLNDEEILEHFRVIAFDMPWHGKSSPPDKWWETEYKLTTEDYVGMIRDVSKALQLEKPVAMGCSIGGRIVLHLALDHPEEFRALIGLQSAASVEKYYDPVWLNHPEVHGGEACGAIAYGLCSPLAPDDHKWETVWHYMQGGPGIFTGDLYFYQEHGDIRDRVGEIDTSKVPLYMLTGEYDYSASPRDTQMAADLIDGAEVTIMKGLGHFPMSEDPGGFLPHLKDVLKKIRAAE